jgi:stage II sporulation protein AA (anti-sigma F factor antagonist)
MIRLDTKKIGDKLFVYPKGRVNMEIASEIEDALNQLIDEGCKFLVVNMKDVEYMSTPGFRVIIAVFRRITSMGGTFHVCEIRPSVKRIFEILELQHLIDIYNTEADAMAP